MLLKARFRLLGVAGPVAEEQIASRWAHMSRSVQERVTMPCRKWQSLVGQASARVARSRLSSAGEQPLREIPSLGVSRRVLPTAGSDADVALFLDGCEFVAIQNRLQPSRTLQVTQRCFHFALEGKVALPEPEDQRVPFARQPRCLQPVLAGDLTGGQSLGDARVERAIPDPFCEVGAAVDDRRTRALLAQVSAQRNPVESRDAAEEADLLAIQRLQVRRGDQCPAGLHVWTGGFEE